MYATVSAKEEKGGLYRSNDAGESWTKMSGDTRLWDRGDDFAEIKADPKNEDVVYDANVVVCGSHRMVAKRGMVLRAHPAAMITTGSG